MKKLFLIIVIALILSGCVVRQEDLDSWVGQPVEALETHSWFITVPVIKTKASNGIEIWNYRNGRTTTSCSAYGSGSYVSSSAFATCSENEIVCNNIFYIKNGRVLEYRPTGRCYTDASLQPQRRYNKPAISQQSLNNQKINADNDKAQKLWEESSQCSAAAFAAYKFETAQCEKSGVHVWNGKKISLREKTIQETLTDDEVTNCTVIFEQIMKCNLTYIKNLKAIDNDWWKTQASKQFNRYLEIESWLTKLLSKNMSIGSWNTKSFSKIESGE